MLRTTNLSKIVSQIIIGILIIIVVTVTMINKTIKIIMMITIINTYQVLLSNK